MLTNHVNKLCQQTMSTNHVDKTCVLPNHVLTNHEGVITTAIPDACLGGGVAPQLNNIVQHANICVPEECQLPLRIRGHLLWQPACTVEVRQMNFLSFSLSLSRSLPPLSLSLPLSHSLSLSLAPSSVFLADCFD
jgi:hypothetical protein